MKNAITYENAIPSAKELCGLFASVGWGEGFTLQKVEAMLAIHRPISAITARDNGKVVGFGKLLEDGIRCLIYDVVVHPEYARRRVGTNIVNELCSIARKNGYKYVRLFHWKDNPAAKSLYETLGFTDMDNAMQKNLS